MSFDEFVNAFDQIGCVKVYDNYQYQWVTISNFETLVDKASKGASNQLTGLPLK